MTNQSNRPIPILKKYYKDEEGRRKFVDSVFDQGAHNYDRIDRIMAFGTGPWYRRQALIRAGLVQGMTVLDVAAGTGLVTREIIRVTGDPEKVVALDPSSGMLAKARETLPGWMIRGTGEQLPFPENYFDFLSMGYALRHLSDLRLVFSEFNRVLKPGGRVCLLEISRPAGRVRLALLKSYLKGIIPVITRVTTGHASSALMMSWYWDTIENCVDPETVSNHLAESGFAGVKRHLELGIFSEYTGCKSETRAS